MKTKFSFDPVNSWGWFEKLDLENTEAEEVVPVSVIRTAIIFHAERAAKWRAESSDAWLSEVSVVAALLKLIGLKSDPWPLIHEASRQLAAAQQKNPDRG
jgi:hypothetical protein